MRRCVEAEMRVCEDVERCISVDAWKRGCVNVRMSEFILYKVERAAFGPELMPKGAHRSPDRHSFSDDWFPARFFYYDLIKRARDTIRLNSSQDAFHLTAYTLLRIHAPRVSIVTSVVTELAIKHSRWALSCKAFSSSSEGTFSPLNWMVGFSVT